AADEVCAGTVHLVPEPTPPPAPVDCCRSVGCGSDPAADERTMIVSAVAQLPAREGYAALTVPGIRSAAGVSRRRFDDHFEGVVDCFLAALELLVGDVNRKVQAAYRTAADWSTGIYRAVATTCTEIAADPLLVRLLFFELFVPGRET